MEESRTPARGGWWEEEGAVANPEPSSVTLGKCVAGKKLLLKLWGQKLNCGQGRVGGKRSASIGAFKATGARSPSVTLPGLLRMNCRAFDFPPDLAP